MFLGTFTPPNPSGFLKGDGPGEISLVFLRVHVLPREAASRAPGTAKTSAPQGLTVQYSLYSLDRRLAREVVNAGAGSEAPWEKLQSALQEKRARIEHVFAINTRSGLKCDGTEGDGVIYGTQYSPPEYVPPAGPADPARSGDKKQTVAALGRPGARIPGATEVVEVRRVGLVYELEPVLSPDGTAVLLPA